MTSAYRFDPVIIRENDVRGVYGETLTTDDTYALGRAYATVALEAGGRRIAVAYDGRLSSPALEGALVAGLSDGGVHVLRIGCAPSPMLYYAVHEYGLDGGLIITGSHNPPDYNGCKMMLGRESLHGDGIRRLAEIAASGKFSASGGTVEDFDVADAYVARLAKDWRGGADLTIVWDAGNGATGDILQCLAKQLPGRHVLLNAEIDGLFPAHHPDPTIPENLVELSRTVADVDADFGVSFDGDGDRLGIVDPAGRIIWGDQMIALLAREVLSEHPGAPIIADVKASDMLFEEIARLGGKPVMYKTGHSLIKAKMQALNSPLAGEMSGHIFVADHYYGFDDALYVAIRFAGLVAADPGGATALLDSLPVMVNTPEIRIDCPEERKFSAVEEVRSRLHLEGAEVNEIDGVRVSRDGGWWLLRASNTQAVLVARCEARDQTTLDRLKAELIAQLKQSGLAPSTAI